MTSQNAHSYLEAQVLTASPQKLQLILIEAAIRFAKRGKLLREQNNEEAACEAIGRAQQIVIEIISAMNPDIDPFLVGQVVSIYSFISKSLLQANLPANNAKLDDAIRVLEEERTTWRLLCEQVAVEEGTEHNEAAMLQRQTDTQRTQKPGIDAVTVHATAGDSSMPQGNPFAAAPATYAPTSFFYSGAGVSSHTGISGPSHLSGPTKKIATESVSEPTSGGFSIDA